MVAHWRCVLLHPCTVAAQLMEEGAKLSKRQLELEGSTKKLRQQLKASEAEREKLGALLAAGNTDRRLQRRRRDGCGVHT